MGLSVLWGLLLTTRVMRAVDRPAWLLDLHRWLGTLTWSTLAAHLVSLYLDSYVQFSARDFFVPLTSTWKPAAVAWGIIGMYLILVVQITSRFMKKLPRPLWHGLHLLSYPAFATVTVHSFAAGSDSDKNWFFALGAVLVALVFVLTIARVLIARQPKDAPQRRARAIS